MERSSLPEVDSSALNASGIVNLATLVGERKEIVSSGKRRTRAAKAESHRSEQTEESDHHIFSELEQHACVFTLAAELLCLRDTARLSYASSIVYARKETVSQARLALAVNMDRSRQTWKKYVYSCSNQHMNQFDPWYFGVAFSFCFKYCIGMPDMPKFFQVSRHRRLEDAPRIGIEAWARTITRRVESQLRRDWSLEFTMSSVVFHCAFNFSRALSVQADPGSCRKSVRHTPQELETGAIEVCKALQSNYRTPEGRLQKVGGDMTKVQYVRGLSAAAKFADNKSTRYGCTKSWHGRGRGHDEARHQRHASAIWIAHFRDRVA